MRAAAGGGSITQQQQLADVLAERDAAVAALEVKLERALESCNRWGALQWGRLGHKLRAEAQGLVLHGVVGTGF